MKLPGADYSRGMSSFGRQDPGGPMQVAEARFRAGSAQGAVAQAFMQVAGVAEAWAEAEDRMAAVKALGKYHETVSGAISEITKSPVIKAEEIPGNVNYRKQDTTSDGLAVDRELVPSWEVAPAMYDQIEKQAAGTAVSSVYSRKVRAQLEAQLLDSRTQTSAKVSAFHFEGRKEALKGSFEEGLQGMVNAGATKNAVEAVRSAVEAGILTPAEGVKREQKVMNDAANLQASQIVAGLMDPKQLEDFAVKVYFEKGFLTDEQARTHGNAAIAKADRISAKILLTEEKETKKVSKSVFAEMSVKIRLQGYIPTVPELKALEPKMTSTDFASLVALVDRKDGNGTLATNPGTAMDLQRGIIGLGNVDAKGLPVDQRADAMRDQINQAFVERKLSLKDRDQFILDLERYSGRATDKDPRYKNAEELINNKIMPPSGIMAKMDFNDVQRYNSIAADMKLGLADARNKNPRLDPAEWVKSNLSVYTQRVYDDVYENLRKQGLDPYIVYTPQGELDKVQTKAALDARGYMGGKGPVSAALYQTAINILTPAPAPVPAKGKKP